MTNLRIWKRNYLSLDKVIPKTEKDKNALLPSAFFFCYKHKNFIKVLTSLDL